jgi:AmmeMemoRadiSam system protein A
LSGALTPEEGAALLALARAAIEDRLFDNAALAKMQRSVPETPALAGLRACFVTLKSPGASGVLELRGCIGSTEPRLPAREAIVESALDAAFADPRFPPLHRDELPGLVVSVSLLTPIVPVPGPEAIVVGQDGVSLEFEGGAALFLPEVAAEQGWNRVELLEHLARKAGLPAEAWKKARLLTFQSERFGETEERAARIRRS